MSDRAATEIKFHSLFQSYREKLLPAIYSNWHSLSDYITYILDFTFLLISLKFQMGSYRCLKQAQNRGLWVLKDTQKLHISQKMKKVVLLD